MGIYPCGATPEGICDLAGNVWEWCADGYEAYTGTAVSNPHGPEQATRRVMRGGSWGNFAWICRAAVRFWDEPLYRVDFLGFRVARGPSG